MATIIDIHVHHHLGEESTSSPVPVQPLIEQAARVGIGHLNLLGNLFRFGVNPTADHVREINTVTINQVASRPNILGGFCYLNPELDVTFLEDEIARCIVNGPLSGIKLEIDVNCRDRRLDTIMDVAANLHVPVLHHSWYISTGLQEHASDPADIADLATRHPNTTIIMAHLTGVGMRGVRDIQPFPNTLIDTSGGQPVSGMVEYAVNRLGPERIVYGSDTIVRDFACQIGKVTGAAIPSRYKDMILYQNARRLLNPDRRRKVQS